MEAIIPKSNIKLFCKIMTSMMRTGDELGLVVSMDALTLIAINASKSAFLKVELSVSGFFDEFTLLAHPNDRNALPGIPECTVPMKYVANALKSIAMTNRLRLCIDPSSDMFIVEHECQEGIMRLCRVPLIDTNVLRANYAKEEYPIVLIADPHYMQTAILSNFGGGSGSGSGSGSSAVSGGSGAGNSEIVFSIDHTNERITIQNHVDRDEELQLPAAKKKTTLNTSMYFNLRDTFGVEGDLQPGIEMTFSIRDFKQFVSMCEGSSSEIRIYMHQQGRPIAFSCRTPEDDVRSDLLLATLGVSNDASSDGGEAQSQQSSVSPPYRQSDSTTTASTSIDQTYGRHTASNITESSNIASPSMSHPISSPESTHARRSKSHRMRESSSGNDARSLRGESSSNPFSPNEGYADSIYMGGALHNQAHAYSPVDHHHHSNGLHDHHDQQYQHETNAAIAQQGGDNNDLGRDNVDNGIHDVPAVKRRRY